MASTLLFEACQSGDLNRVTHLVRSCDYDRTDLIQGMFISRYHGWAKIHDLLDTMVFPQLCKNTIYRVEGYQFCIADQTICRNNLLIKELDYLYPPTDLILLHTHGRDLSQVTVSYDPNPFYYIAGCGQIQVQEQLQIEVPVIELTRKEVSRMVLELSVREWSGLTWDNFLSHPRVRPIDRKLIPACVHIRFDHQNTRKPVLRFYLSQSSLEIKTGFNFASHYL